MSVQRKRLPACGSEWPEPVFKHRLRPDHNRLFRNAVMAVRNVTRPNSGLPMRPWFWSGPQTVYFPRALRSFVDFARFRALVVGREGGH